MFRFCGLSSHPQLWNHMTHSMPSYICPASLVLARSGGTWLRTGGRPFAGPSHWSKSQQAHATSGSTALGSQPLSSEPTCYICSASLVHAGTGGTWWRTGGRLFAGRSGRPGIGTWWSLRAGATETTWTMWSMGSCCGYVLSMCCSSMCSAASVCGQYELLRVCVWYEPMVLLSLCSREKPLLAWSQAACGSQQQLGNTLGGSPSLIYHHDISVMKAAHPFAAS